MKRYVHASEEMPEDYLKTSKFTAPSIKTDDQRNALEALEIAISQKFKQFDSMCDRQFYLTSSASWTGTITEYDNGDYYIQLGATRANFTAYVSGDQVKRKPRNSAQIQGHYDVDGENGTVYWMSQFKPNMRQ